MKVKRKCSIKSRIVGIVMLCWCVPVFLTLGVIGYYIFSNHFGNKAAAQIEQLAFSNRICAERLDGLVKAAKQVTYDREIENAFAEYERGRTDQRSLLETSGSYLKETLGRNVKIKDMVLWFYENPGKMYWDNFNKGAEGSYQEVNIYWNEDHGEIYEYAKTLNTGIGFYSKEDRVYLVRNLVDRSYRPMGALVLRINRDYCFDKVTNFPARTDVTIKLNSCAIPLQGEVVTEEEIKLKEGIPVSGYEWADNRLYFFHKMEGSGYWMETLVRIMDSSSYMPFYGYQFIIIGTLLLALPLLGFSIRIFNRYMASPMDAMVAGAREIEQGTLGYQITEQAKSTEFEYLIETFNQMSTRIKEQFTQIYEEEIALKDAKIMALQSHINPHFLNNTLEIINWEARMAGDQKVSQMIEALSVLMDATIDRQKRPEVLLSEEMIYVKAYLYIAQRRLGSRLEVINELPEDIMQYEVPRLILQPVIENAIEHGAAKHKHGIVHLNGCKEGKYLYIEITNDSALTGEEEEKIARLLDIGYDTSKEPSGNMGIANVNQRLHILYGEPCGLTIKREGADRVMARLTILADKDNKIMQ